MSMQILPVTAVDQVTEVRRLFEEYWKSFGFTPCFQHFDRELAALPDRMRHPAAAWLFSS